MPVILDNAIKVGGLTLFGDWYYFPIEKADLPAEATAIIFRVWDSSAIPRATNVVDWYPNDVDDYGYLSSLADTFDCLQTSYRELIRPLGGQMAYYTSNSILVYITGYFTEEEFVPFTTRTKLEYNATSTSPVEYDIRGESWYRPEATAYLTGIGNLEVTPTGLVYREDSYPPAALSTEVSTILKEDTSGNVLLRAPSTGAHHRCIGGYFICDIDYLDYPGGRKMLHATNRPIASSQEQTWLTGHRTDKEYSFGVVMLEAGGAIQNPEALTRPASYLNEWTPSSSYDYNDVGAGGGSTPGELFVYPSYTEGSVGQFDLFTAFGAYANYNYDSYVTVAAFVRCRIERNPSTLVVPDLELTGPSVVTNESASAGLQIVYNTSSGDYVWSGPVGVFLSGGSTNSDPNLSLGGEISSTQAGTDLLPALTNRKAQLGSADYRCVYIKNLNGTQTAYGLIVWVDNQAQLSNKVYVGADPSGPGGTATTIPNEFTHPQGVNFSSPSSSRNALYLGSLAPGQSVPLWIFRDSEIQNSDRGTDNVVLGISVMNNG